MIKPIYDNVVILIEDESDVIEYGNGLKVKKAAGQKTQDTGVIVAVGEGRIALDGTIIPLRVKEKDRVIFNKFAGTEVKIEDNLYLVLKESDILAVF